MNKYLYFFFFFSGSWQINRNDDVVSVQGCVNIVSMYICIWMCVYRNIKSKQVNRCWQILIIKRDEFIDRNERVSFSMSIINKNLQSSHGQRSVDNVSIFKVV